VVSNAMLNAGAAISVLREKFDAFVVGPASTAQDRIVEHGMSPLRACRYAPDDAKYMKDCANCCKAAGTFTVIAGQTPVYAGAPTNYGTTQYHGGNYAEVPVRANIPCDWPYAIRRYNGSGIDSYDYQAEVLTRIAG
jgi:hypothetical protein